MSKTAAFMMFTAAVIIGGCAIDEESNGDPPSSISTSAVTVGVTNIVVANALYLRSTDASNGTVIGQMDHCSFFHVDRVDWDTRMAYGYSSQLRSPGWARVSDGANVYLSIDAHCEYTLGRAATGADMMRDEEVTLTSGHTRDNDDGARPVRNQ